MRGPALKNQSLQVTFFDLMPRLGTSTRGVDFKGLQKCNYRHVGSGLFIHTCYGQLWCSKSTGFERQPLIWLLEIITLLFLMSLHIPFCCIHHGPLGFRWWVLDYLHKEAPFSEVFWQSFFHLDESQQCTLYRVLTDSNPYIKCFSDRVIHNHLHLQWLCIVITIT